MNNRIIYFVSLFFATSSLAAMNNTECNTQRPRRQLPKLNKISKKIIPKYKSIHEGVQHKCSESVNYWVEQGHLDCIDNLDQTPLMISVRKDNYEILELLINANANLNLQDKYGNTALMNAASDYYTTTIIELLIDAGADLNLQNDNGETALMEVVGTIQSNPTVLELLINAKADLNLQDNEGYTALMRTICVNSTERYKCLKLLIDAHAAFNITTKKGKNALDVVREDKFGDQAEIILNKLKTITSINDYEKLKFICRYEEKFKDCALRLLLALKVKEKENPIFKIPKPLKFMILLFVWFNDSRDDSDK